MENLNSKPKFHFYIRRGNFPDFDSSGDASLEFLDYVFDRRLLTSLMVALPIVYGGIHLSAWNFEFPSVTEDIMWKVASITIALTIPFWLAHLWVMTLAERVMLGVDRPKLLVEITDEMGTWIFAILTYVLLPGALLASRLYIVVEAFISLRSVPLGVYWTPAWIQMVPHA